MHLYTGCVENRQDPLKLGRCQVRVVGLHNYDKTQLKTEDLPWAYPMQPITSAGISGVGHTPLGPVEGSWVVVMFRDDDEQQPIILGTIGGIPQAQGTIDQDNDQMILKEDGMLAGSDGQTTTDANGDTTTNTSSTPGEEDVGLNLASKYTPSSDAINLIKQYEGLRLTAYQDSVGIWTIGYGTTTINGVAVYEGQTITQAQADEYLLEHMQSNVSPIINTKVKAPITQSMYDALCCFTYNLGSGNLSKSTLLKELNTTKYLDTATSFLDYNKAGGVVLAGLTKRRSAEKDLFLKDGIPSISGDLTPVQGANAPVDSSNTSSGLNNGGAAVVMGFKDPKGKYPLYLNEPDTNKLARHEDIKKTIVYKKELAREKAVLTAAGKTWDQAHIPYNASYPYNHVFMTESGHIMEFDDTQHSERVHIYHKSGTFTEIDANGTQVNRIVGDNYEILERNGHVYIKGTMDVTIDGDHNVKVNNALNVEVSGKTTINVYNDAVLNVSGGMDVAVKEHFSLKAASINLESTSGDINIKSAGSLNEAAPDMSVNASAYRETVGTSNYRWEGIKRTYTGANTFERHDSGTDFSCISDPVRGSGSNCGNVSSAAAADGTGLNDPIAKASPELPEFTDLVVITRGAEAAAHYETPEEGDATAYIAKQINDGTLRADEKDFGTAQGSATASPNNVTPLPQSCNLISSMDKFTPDLQLSTHFNLGSLTKNGTRMPVNQQGLTAQEIVCNLKGLAENCLEPIIGLYPSMIITSGFRRPNDVAASSKTSQHYLGQAADIVIPGFSRQKHYDAIQAIQQLIPYDQLILEYSGANTVWIHVSFKYTANRQMAFTMRDHTKVGDTGQFTLIA
jgi:lysozyme